MNKILGIFLFAAIASAPATAATVTLTGDTITYEYDDVSNAAALALFGTPVIVGDDVRFLPPSFGAISVDGGGSGLVTANFVFSRVYSNSGAALSDVSVVEFGDYEITTGDAVGADLLLTVTNNDLPQFTSDADSVDALGDSGGLQTFLMTASVNPSLAFDGANDVALSIQNTLQAMTNALGDISWIQKKITIVSVAAIPVPAALWLFGSALGLLAWARRRVAD